MNYIILPQEMVRPQNPMPRYRCRWLLGFALLAPAPAWLAPRRLALLLAGSAASISVGCTAQELGDPGRKVPLGEPGEPGEVLGNMLGNMLGKMPGENSLLGSLEMGQD